MSEMRPDGRPSLHALIQERLAGIGRTREPMPVSGKPAQAGGGIWRELAGQWRGLEALRSKVDLLITPNDMNMRHGSGVLMTRIMEEAPSYVSMRAFNSWGGFQTIQPFYEFSFNQFSRPRADIEHYAVNRIDLFDVQTIVNICFTREDAIMAIAAKRLTGAPLTVYVMDDNALLTDGIPRDIFDELIGLADWRFVISETMRRAYEAEFGLSFDIIPPTVHPPLIRKSASAPPAPAMDGVVRAAVVGNIWHQTWFDGLLEAARGAKVAITWFVSADEHSWLKTSPTELAEAGISIVSTATPAEIAAALLDQHMIIIPSSDGRETDQHARAIGRLSLPSKMPFVAATAGTPQLVLHDAQSGAADFVRHFGIGLATGYGTAALREAAERLAEPAEQARIRAAAHVLAQNFSSSGVYAMLTGAAEASRFNSLFAEP